MPISHTEEEQTPPAVEPPPSAASVPLENEIPPVPKGFPPPDAHRMGLLPPYLLGRLNRLNDHLREQGVDVIDFGMGNPIEPVQAEVLDTMQEVLKDEKTHRYTSPRGIPPLKKAFARHYDRRFDVTLNPENEVIMTIGSKDALSHLCLASSGPPTFARCPPRPT